MVNPFSLAKEAYNKAKYRYDERQQNKAVRTAEQLKELKKRRLALEGRVKIYKTKEQEEMKLKKANEELKKRSTLGRLKEEILKRQGKGKDKRRFGRLPGENWG